MDIEELTEKDENRRKKEYLNSYRAIQQQIERYEIRLRAVRENATSISVSQDGMPHGSEGVSDLSGYAAKVDELERKIEETRISLLDRLDEICDAIEALEDETEKDVLMLRYIQREKWEEIALRIGYSRKQMHRIHANAFDHFEILER